MNKLKESINKIELREEDKNRMLKNILNHEEKSKFTMKILVTRFAVFFMAFILLSGSCYALVKIFEFDNMFLSWFDKSSEELSEYGVSGTDVNITKEFDDAIITLKQTVLDEKELYIMVEIEGKEKTINLSDEFYLSSGEKFDESIIEKLKMNDGSETSITNCRKNNIYGCYSNGFGLLKEEGNINGYALNISIDGKIKDNQTVTLRLISDEGKNYDISFTLNKNEMKVKQVKADKKVYDENAITIEVSEIRLTPLHVIVDMKYNKDIRALDPSEEQSISDKVFEDEEGIHTYVIYKDGTKTPLMLEPYGSNSPYGIHGTKENQVNDIDNITSVTINDITFEVK